jgi:hypothetical protein
VIFWKHATYLTNMGIETVVIGPSGEASGYPLLDVYEIRAQLLKG